MRGTPHEQNNSIFIYYISAFLFRIVLYKPSSPLQNTYQAAKMKFSTSSYISVVFTQLILLSQFNFIVYANEPISKSISPAMKKVTIDTVLFQPDQNPEFLQQTIFYGGERFTLAADDLFQEVFGYGFGLTTVQYPLGQLKGDDFIPGGPDGYGNYWKDGAYGMAISCQKEGESIVKKMNQDCHNCGKSYFLGATWGILKGMNFDKDAVLIAGCSVLEVVNSNNCFTNFPKSCPIRAVGHPFDLWNNVPTRIAVNSKSRAEIIAAIKKYAASKHQNIAVPPF